MESTPASLPSRLPTRPRSFSGWPYKTACDLDTASPSFLTHVAYASNAKRQAVFAAIASVVTGGGNLLRQRLGAATGITSPDHLAQTGRALVHLKAREVVRAVFGDVPDGLLGILGRLGPDPVKRPTLYRDLFATFAEPEHRARAKLLRLTFRTVSEARVEIALRLDPILCHQPVFDGTTELDEVDALNAALALIRVTVSVATDENLRQSVSQIAPDANVGQWVLGWLRRQDRLLAELPIHGDPDLIWISTADLASAGRELGNCLASKVLHSATGKQCFYRWLPKPGGVVEMTRLHDGRWIASEVRRAHNLSPDPITAAAISRRLHAHGVATIDWPFPAASTRAIAGLTGDFDLMSDWSGIEGIGDMPDEVTLDRVAA